MNQVLTGDGTWEHHGEPESLQFIQWLKKRCKTASRVNGVSFVLGFDGNLLIDSKSNSTRANDQTHVS